MMNLKKLSLILVLAAGLAACGEPKIDTSSDEAFKKSVAKIEEKLSQKEKEDFAMSLGLLTLTVAMEAVKEGKSPEDALNKKIHGKTASEIIELAKK